MDAAASAAISFVALAPDKVELPVTYPASRRKMLVLLGISLLFVAIGIWMLRDSQNTLVAGLTTGFFGLGVVTALVNMHPHASYLTLSERGFEFSSLFRKHFVAWSDVAEFVPISMSGNAMVGFYYAATKQAPTMRHVSNFITGIEAALPDTYGHSNVELAKLLNELRRNFAAKSGLSVSGSE